MPGRDSLGGLRRSCLADSSPTRDEAGHHGSFARIALAANLLIEPGGVVTTLVPALLQVIGELAYLGWSTMWRFTFRKLSSPQPTPNCLPLHLQFASDLGLRAASLEQGHDLLVPLQSS